MKKFLMVGFLLFALSGCASVNQYVPLPDQSVKVEDPTKARLYVIRPAGSVGGAISMAILDNGVLIGDTGPKSHLCWEREPGEVTITGKSENSSWIKLDVEANEVYYIQQSMKMGLIIYRNKLELIDKIKGEELVKKTKPAKLAENKKKVKVEGE